MATYISSNANRFYTAQESVYGQVPAVTAANRIPALKLAVQQRIEAGERRDKTGTRTFAGRPPGGRKRTDYELQTYLTSWDKLTPAPAYGPLFEGALGGAPLTSAGGAVASARVDGLVEFDAPHLLVSGQAVNSGGEIRFVTGIASPTAVQLNAPFLTLPETGAPLGSTLTYLPATELSSVSLFDYWSPETAVQRVLNGAIVDQMEILVNGDFHEVHFSGPAKDVLDSVSFESGQGGLTEFPAEPELAAFDYAVVPGNLGQAWIGTVASRFCTITRAAVVVKNGVDTRSKEFGACAPRSFAPGQRVVTAAFDLFSQDDEASQALYQAARQGSPIRVMFQLGETAGQILGVYLNSVVPEVPEFDDGETRLQWKFRASRAQGSGDDEVVVGFA
jgi:hypothetical protein